MFFMFVVFFPLNLFLHRLHFVSSWLIPSHFTTRCSISMFGIRSGVFCEYNSGKRDCDECSDYCGQDLFHGLAPLDSVGRMDEYSIVNAEVKCLLTIYKATYIRGLEQSRYLLLLESGPFLRME